MQAILLVSMLLINVGFVAGCKKQAAEQTLPVADTMKLNITIGQTQFKATLYDNATTAALKKQLPMTVNMVDLNDNEKYFDLPSGLPTDASNPGTIQVGDLMLYGANTLVLFYKSFNTSYNYTRIGRIDDTAGLATALGSGNVTVTFNVE